MCIRDRVEAGLQELYFSIEEPMIRVLADIEMAVIDTPIDYDSLIAIGSMMGSGGLIVMDEDNCMVDIAKFFLEFIVDESCGKCTPCRIGTKRLLDLLTKITEGDGTLENESPLHPAYGYLPEYY